MAVIDSFEFSPEVFYENFSDGLQRQEEAFTQVKNGELLGRTLAFEFSPVVTAGLRTKADELFLRKEEYLQRGVELLDVDRGGGVTYHGPGQLVIYPVWNLRALKLGIKRFTALWLGAIAAAIQEHGIVAQPRLNPAGVWVGERKLAFSGLRVREGISTHGFSVNLLNNIESFSLFLPCGLHGVNISSVEGERPGLRLSSEQFFTRVSRLIQEAVNLGV